MPDIFDTLAPEDQATDQSFAEPTPAGDIFDQIAPEGGGQTGDIFDQISPEPATPIPQTQAALRETEQFTGTPAELAKLQTEPKPQIATSVGRGLERALETVVPTSLGGVGKMAGEMAAGMVVPITMEDVRTAQNVGKVIGGAPIEQTFQEKPFTQYNLEDWVALGGSIGAQALMAIPLFRGLRPQVRSHILDQAARGEPTGIEAELGQRPAGYVGPGTAAEDVGRAMERRFTMEEPPPEAAPEIAPAGTMEETLARTAPRVSPEGGEYFPEAGVGAPPEVPPVAETARIGGEEPYAITERQVQEGGVGEYQGVPPRENVPAYPEEVRAVEGERAGGGGGIEPAAQEQVEPAAAGAHGESDFAPFTDVPYKKPAVEVAVQLANGEVVTGLPHERTHAQIVDRLLEEKHPNVLNEQDAEPGWVIKGKFYDREATSKVLGHKADTASSQFTTKEVERITKTQPDVVPTAPGGQVVEPAAAGAQPPPVQTGISQARTEAELGAGSVEPGVGHELGSGLEYGRKYINEGGDPEAPIRRAEKTGMVSPKSVGIVHAELEHLRSKRNAAAKLLEENPNNPTVRAEFDAADAAQRAWRKKLQPVLTKASDALREAHAQSMPDADPATYQGLADLMDEHFKGQREVTPEMRTQMAKAAKGVKDVRDIANGEMHKVEQTLERQLPKGKKVMTPDELDVDLKKELETQFKDCILNG